MLKKSPVINVSNMQHNIKQLGFRFL